MKHVVAALVASMLIAHPPAAPTAESALAADEEMARTLQANDADGFGRWLDSDWSVISATGGLGDGIREGFIAAIKSGALTRKTAILSDSKVRLYGDVAVVTSQFATSGMFGGKPFDVKERQTDVLVWRDGGWKCVLTHESYLHPKTN
jgi:ketosteroid isomerase-like protein